MGELIGVMHGVYLELHTKANTPMALDESAVDDLLDALRVGQGADLVRLLMQWALQQLIDAEATERIGAAHYERSVGRVRYRNGSRPRVLATKAGDMDLASRTTFHSHRARWEPSLGGTTPRPRASMPP